MRLSTGDWWLLAAAAVGAGGLLLEEATGGLGSGLLSAGATVAARGVLDAVDRGSRLTYSTMGADGVIVEDPADLCAQMGAAVGRAVSQDAADLARMIRSEGAAAGIIRAHVALNDAAAHNWSLHFTLTYSTNPTAKGRYGDQYTPASQAPGGVASSRRYSTAHDPYEGDLTVAEQAIADDANGIDPSGGAVKFLDKASLKVQVGARDYDTIVADWAQDGLAPFTLPGFSSDFVVFRRV